MAIAVPMPENRAWRRAFSMDAESAATALNSRVRTDRSAKGPAHMAQIATSPKTPAQFRIRFAAAKTAAYQYTLEATFDGNDLCTKMIETETYSSSSAANAAWEAYKANYASMPSEWAKYKKDGKSIICDYTDDWKGKSKAEVRQYFEWMKEELDHYSQK